MKNRILMISAFMFALCSTLVGQTPQMRQWYIAPKIVEMPLSASPVVTPMPTINGFAPAQALQVANGMYDDAGNLLFYVSDNDVYDYNNSLIGSIDPANGGSEIVIAPFGDNNSCRNKFNIFTTSANANGEVSLVQTIVDLRSFSLTSDIVFSMPIDQEFGALALSNPYPSGLRFLYFLGGSGTINSLGGGMIYKLTVNFNGTVTTPTLFFPATPYVNDGAEVFSRELDLSPDGRYMAWASLAPANSSPMQNRYHILLLDAAGDYAFNSYQQFNIPGISGNNASGFRGVEFYQSGANTTLFLGSGTNGIFGIELPFISFPPQSNNFIHVTNSDVLNLGNSQIEYSYNAHMYAASGNSSPGNVGAFNPVSLNPSIIPFPQSFSLINPLPPNSIPSGDPFYTLPDQIDGQNYDAIVPAAAPPVTTASSYNLATGNIENWTYGTGNPWGVSSPVQIIHELLVTANTHLTIDGMTFIFSPTAKVVVEPGSSLTLDNGSVFTSNHVAECPEPYTWIGVEVWGDVNASQNYIPSTGTYAQGRFVMQHNSRIEFARWGISAWSPPANHVPDPASLSTSGGIVNISTGSVIYNCNTGLELKPYPNFSQPYKALVSSSNFEADDDYPFTTPPVFASIEGCNGVMFSNTGFHMNTTDQSLLGMHSIGVKAVDGSFTVNPGSAFINLWRGIDAKRISVSRPFGVSQSTFTGNQTGIYVKAVNDFLIRSCTLSVGGNLFAGASTQVGLSLQNCSGYVIEENLFQGYTGSFATRQGIVISNSGAADNQIYKNQFENLDFGNIAGAVNRDNSNARLHGLQFLCNTNIGNTTRDFFIGKQTGTIPYGIRAHQGTTQKSAGNTFSGTGPSGIPTDIQNKAAALRYFFWNNYPAQVPVYYNSSAVISSPATIQNTCPSNICNDCLAARIPEITLASYHNNFNLSENAYLNLLYVYNELMDG